MTNSGNKYRERMATMIQEDLRRSAIQVNVVTLDFPSLIERMTQTFNYEAILLGFTMSDWIPIGNECLVELLGESPMESPAESSGNSWEAEIDRLMRPQRFFGPKEAKRSLRSRAGNRSRAGPIHLSGQQECVVGGFFLRGWSIPVILSPQTYWNIGLSLGELTL